jgi:hypothetical protein
LCLIMTIFSCLYAMVIHGCFSSCMVPESIFLFTKIFVCKLAKWSNVLKKFLC